MCGIVGLHLRDPGLYPRLGELLAGMLVEMAERGADSAGVAVYGDPGWSPPGRVGVCLLDVGLPPERVAAAVGDHLGSAVVAEQLDATTLLHAPVDPQRLLEAATTAFPDVLVGGFGSDVTVLKGVGHPDDLVARYRLRSAQGWQGVGHTRMATESAVTAGGCHPYSVGPDQCLVHNGSFANHATIRRELIADGIRFDSDNDTEVGARFVARALADGLTLEAALKSLCATFDGFYTLLVSSADSFAVVRDAIACKPAVIAETDDWVAMASEYRALVGLPGIEHATIFEPEPEVVYAWTR
jgi:amidophosphoribosyltransferase